MLKAFLWATQKVYVYAVWCRHCRRKSYIKADCELWVCFLGSSVLDAVCRMRIVNARVPLHVATFRSRVERTKMFAFFFWLPKRSFLNFQGNSHSNFSCWCRCYRRQASWENNNFARLTHSLTLSSCMRRHHSDHVISPSQIQPKFCAVVIRVSFAVALVRQRLLIIIIIIMCLASAHAKFDE